MRGFPKHLNSKQDFLNLIEGYPEKTRAAIQELLDEKDQWLSDGLLDAGDKGITDGSHKVVEVENAAGEVERYQYVFKENPDARLFRLGFTAGELLNLMNQ